MSSSEGFDISELQKRGNYYAIFKVEVRMSQLLAQLLNCKCWFWTEEAVGIFDKRDSYE